MNYYKKQFGDCFGEMNETHILESDGIQRERLQYEYGLPSTMTEEPKKTIERADNEIWFENGCT